MILAANAKPIGQLKEFEIEYPVSEDEDVEDKVYMGMNFVAGTTREPELYLAMEVLEHLLLGTAAAPLKRALIEAEIGKDVFGAWTIVYFNLPFSI